MDGLLVIDKPSGLTSHDVVARVRRITGTRRVGHTGTLDPMATGVLVLCLGKATRLIPYIEEMGGPDAKEYEATIRFGIETTTDDAEGEPRSEPSVAEPPSAESVRTALVGFVGDLDQVPPAYSAKKVDGERAYALARRGEDVELKPVRIQVGSAVFLDMVGNTARIRFACSRGTYIRALARDLGRSLNVGAHLVGLRRTRSGSKSLGQAAQLDDLTADIVQEKLEPLASILDHWPAFKATPEQSKDLRLGRAVRTPGSDVPTARRRVLDGAGSLVALVQAEGGSLKPFCVF